MSTVSTIPTTAAELLAAERTHLADLQRWRWEAALTLQATLEAEHDRRVIFVPDYLLGAWIGEGEPFTLVLERTVGGYTPYRAVRVGHFGDVHPGDVVERGDDVDDEVMRWTIVGDFTCVASELVDPETGRRHDLVVAVHAAPLEHEVPC